MCVTTDVSTQCCTDVGGVEEWFFPNGTVVIRKLMIRTGCAN